MTVPALQTRADHPRRPPRALGIAILASMVLGLVLSPAARAEPAPEPAPAPEAAPAPQAAPAPEATTPQLAAQPARRDLTVPLPIGLYTRREGEQRKSLVLLTPPIVHRTDPNGSLLVVGPFYRKQDRARNATSTGLVPLVFLHRSPRYNVTVGFPFFWRIHENDRVSTTVFPFYFRTRGPGLRRDIFFPIGGHQETAAGKTTVVGPFALRRGTDGSRTTVLLPLFGHHRAAPGAGASYLVTPIGGRQYDSARGIDRAIFLPFFRWKEGADAASGILPLAFWWNRGTASKFVSPIYYRQADSALKLSENVLTLFYWGRRDKGRYGGLFPLVLWNDKGDGNRRLTFLPFGHFGTRPDGSFAYTLLFGFSRRASGYQFYAGPVWGRRDGDLRAGALWPLVYHSARPSTGERTTMVLPLYFHTRRATGTSLSAYALLGWHHRNIEGTTTLGLPLFFDRHKYGESRLTGVLPFFVRNRSEVLDRTDYTIPVLLAWGRSRRGTNPGTDAVWFPLVWHFGGKNRSTVVAPFVYDFVRGESRTTVFFPIGAHWKRPGATHTLVLNTYVKKGTGPNKGSYYVNFIPLFAFGRDRPGDVKWNVLEGLFGYSRRGRNRTLQLLWFLDIPLAPASATALQWFGSTPPEARVGF